MERGFLLAADWVKGAGKKKQQRQEMRLPCELGGRKKEYLRRAERRLLKRRGRESGWVNVLTGGDPEKTGRLPSV